MKVLLTGINGQVGCEVMQLTKQFGIQVIGLGHAELDITESQAILKAVKTFMPDMVINAAAYTAVEKAESEMAIADAVNRGGAANIAQTCFEYQIPLLHLSTDYVFDGRKNSPYIESDTENPINIYGKSKYEGEQAIRSILDEHLILRTSWVFGVHGHNFVKVMLRLQEERDRLHIISNTFGCPTAAGDIAQVIMQLANHVKQRNLTQWGTYHYCGNHSTSWFYFAEEVFKSVAEITGQPLPKMNPISANEYPSNLKRPANTTLSCQKIEDVFGIKPCQWRSGVYNVVNTLLSRSH